MENTSQIVNDNKFDVQSNNKPQMLSVEGLNKILTGLAERKMEPLGTFSEVDIVFIAGLFLKFKQLGNDWVKIPQFVKNNDNEKVDLIKLYDESVKKRDLIHQYYFNHIKKLYCVNYSEIFESFPNSKPRTDYKVYDYSASFAPPIYITKDTIDCFFGNKNDISINNLKDSYITYLEKKDDNDDEIKYFKSPKNIIQNLKAHSPIHTFIFSVAYYKINPFIKYKNKISISGNEGVNKLWLFTQEYVRGLYELAKNIVAHSGQDENDGQGMITVRAYPESATDEARVLETHVLDYGTSGIIPKLKKYTEVQVDKLGNIQNLSENQRKIKEAYRNDLNTFKKGDFTLKNFIKHIPLKQQTFRHTGHYGISKLYKLIKFPLNGNMSIVSKNLNGKREYFHENIESTALVEGTHYYFEIPFKLDNFKEIKITNSKQQEFTTFNSSDKLKELMGKEVKSIQLSELNNITNSFNGILDITVRENIDRNFIEDIDNYFGKLSEFKNKYVVALNLENCLNEESNLLRFLGYLTYEYKHSFVIYNLEFKTYKKMIDDNTEFTMTYGWSDFWDENKGILVFTKIPTKEFYFADILCGKTQENYYSINKILSNTFPNSTLIIDEEKKDFSSHEDVRLSDFFHNNALLPYDILFKSGDKDRAKRKELFLYNTETILQNELLLTDKPTTKKIIYEPTKVLENYIEDFEGYCISDTHFKIGNKIHSSDFYYAKRLFQNSFYSVRLAIHLAKKIDDNIKETVAKIENNLRGILDEIFAGITEFTDFAAMIKDRLKQISNSTTTDKYIIKKITEIIYNKIDEINQIWENELFSGNKPESIIERVVETYKKEPITLVGYEMYSELILSLVEKFLHEVYEYEVNHFIAQSEENKLLFLPKIVIEKHYLAEYEKRKTIVIVPIAATGSTAKKIEKSIKERIYTYEKDENKKSEDIARKLAYNYDFVAPSYNILWAKSDEKKFKEGFVETEGQAAVINLISHWHEIKNCPWCYEDNARPLFDTDSSSLTPSLIFGNPKGHPKQTYKGEFTNTIASFDHLDFERSLNYQNVARNDNYRVYDIDSDIFIDDNKKAIEEWLTKVGEKLREKPVNLKSTDRVIIFAPCHESNSKFLNLINEHVFSSSATIIHHQSDIDFIENFNLLNRSYLEGENKKIIYVDDSLITGRKFFELFDLIKEASGKDESPLTASILLNDQAAPFIHERAVKWSKNYFAFVTYNQPPAIRILGKCPLEYEQKRYEQMEQSSLHDVLIEAFHKKANKLDPEKRDDSGADEMKQIRRLKMFEATHKIYKFFTEKENEEIPESIEEIVDFKLCYAKKNSLSDKEDRDINQKALLKVLSHYPFFCMTI